MNKIRRIRRSEYVEVVGIYFFNICIDIQRDRYKVQNLPIATSKTIGLNGEENTN